MKVWILNHYATTPGSPGGTRHYDLATELVRRGCRVTIFASSFSHHTKTEAKPEPGWFVRRDVIEGVEFVWLKTFSYRVNNWRRVLNMMSYAVGVVLVGTRGEERPDVIVASSPHPLAGFAGYALSRVRRTAFVFEVRDLWPQTLVDTGGYDPGSPLVRILRMAERFLYRKADRIVVLMPRASDYMTTLGVSPAKIVYVPNGANPCLFTGEGGQLSDEVARPLSRLKASGKIIVGYVGAHGIANSLHTTLDAARLLSDWGIDEVHFVLVGDGPEKPGIESKAKELGLPNITFFAPIPKKEVPALLRGLDVALITSRDVSVHDYGTSPNKVWDYMMSAKPIVRASRTVLNPVAAAECGIVVPPERPVDLANAILELYSMTGEERREMGKRGQDYVMEYHSTPVLADRLLEVLQGVCNE